MKALSHYRMKYDNSARSAYWDTIKGFLIILVVIGHLFYNYTGIPEIKYLVYVIYTFHMPAFVFVTGYLSKNANSRSSQALCKLLGSYLLFNTIMMVYRFDFNFIYPCYSYWYILAVMVWRIIAHRLSKIRSILYLCVFTAIITGLIKTIDNTFAMSRIITFLPFFMAGYLLDRGRTEKFIKERKPYIRAIGAVTVLAAIAASFFFIKNIDASESDLLMDAYTNSFGPVIRVIIFTLSALIIGGILASFPSKPVPFVTTWGRNSFAVFLLHRFPTLIFSDKVPLDSMSVLNVLAWVCVFTILLFTGNDLVCDITNRAIDVIAGLMTGNPAKKSNRDILAFAIDFAVKATALAVVVFITVFFIFTALDDSYNSSKNSNDITAQTDVSGVKIYPTLTVSDKSKFDSAVRLLFAGDLILLEDAVKNAYNGKEYDFSPVFEYTAKYISEADFAIGVFEGPCAGESAGYSTSNYDDGITLACNYPDSFAQAVKASGFDLVTTANNHIYDKGLDGVLRTIDVLNSVGLINTGTYRSRAENESGITTVDVKGIKVAFLAYTYSSNKVIPEQNSFTTSVLTEPDNPDFEAAKAGVINDFARAQAENPDLIIVLPHMGEQFLKKPDAYQEAWYEVFTEAGADIILSSHSHAVQPVEFRGDTLIVNCPGNFVNSYTDHDGDASALVEIYIDPSDKTVFGAAIIPLYAQAPIGETYRALPVYDIITNDELSAQIGMYELERVRQVHEIVTEVMLDCKLSLDMASPRYYKTADGFIQDRVPPCVITEGFYNSAIVKMLSDAKSVCFLGDSITVGSRNGGTGWYKPLTEHFSNVKIYETAWDSATVQTLLNNSGKITDTDADLYITAIGTNDVRYRDSARCAMTAAEYIERIAALTEQILLKNENAEFVFIAPWPALDNDPNNKCGSVYERDRLFAEYADALAEFCKNEGYLYLDPNPYIKNALNFRPVSKYLIDHIHPGKLNGVGLYSQAAVLAESR